MLTVYRTKNILRIAQSSFSKMIEILAFNLLFMSITNCVISHSEVNNSYLLMKTFSSKIYNELVFLDN